MPTPRPLLVAAVVVGALLLGTASAGLAASRVRLVPASIDQTGKRDVSGRLQAFINSVPNGFTVKFRHKARYRIDTGLQLNGRSRLAIDGNGATLRASGCSWTDSAILLGWGSSSRYITIKHLKIIGSNRAGGTSRAWVSGCESQAGIAAWQSHHISIVDVSIRGVHGDCVYLDLGYGNHSWSSHVVWRNSRCTSTGRMGLNIVGARNVVVHHVTFDRTGMYPFNIEPYASYGGGVNVTFRNNKVRRYTVASQWHPFLFGANGVAGATIRDVTVQNNRVTGGTLRSSVEIPRRRNIVFKDNVSTVTAKYGPVLFFRHVDGLTVTGNVQRISGSGSLALIQDSTHVKYRR